MKKYFIVIGCLLIIKIFNISFFTKEINLCSFMSQFASNLYSKDSTVAQGDIEIIEYEFSSDRLYITPISKEVILPISGIVSDVGKNYIEIQSPSEIYRIYDLKPEYHLYQYYQQGKVLGNSSRYFIETIHFNLIVNHLVIHYEAI